MEKKTIGQFIAILRKANGMTQQDLADKLNVSNKAVSRWERDESAPDITLIPALAEILGVTCDELLKGERITYSQQSEKKEVRVEKQVKALIQREITKYKIWMWVAIAFVFAGPIIMIIIDDSYSWIATTGFFVMLLFEVIAFIIETIAVTKMRDAKVDSEVFDCAEVTLVQKYNQCLGESSFWVYFLIVAIISGIYIPYVVLLPDMSAFLVWILLCVGVYLFTKKRYVAWITGMVKLDTQDKREEAKKEIVLKKKMTCIQIGVSILYGMVFFLAPYFETSPDDEMVWKIVYVLAILLMIVNVVTPIVFIIRENENRKSSILYGLRNIFLFPCGYFLSQIHNMSWIYDDGAGPYKVDSWYWENLIYAVTWGFGVVAIFKLAERVKLSSSLINH